MSRPPHDLRSELDDIGQLLPWYLNGTLSREERLRVEEALADSATLRQRLEETAAALDVAAGRPDTATLVARAANELGAEERAAVDAYLERAPDDAELVQMASEALADSGSSPGAHSTMAPVRPSTSGEAARWRLLAAAAALMAILATWGWWQGRGFERPTTTLAQVQVLELLPDELVLRGTSESPTIDPHAGPVALLLVTDLAGPVGELSLSLRDAAGQEVARLTGLSRAGDGSVSVLLQPAQLTQAVRLVLLGTPPGNPEGPAVELHSYRLDIEASPSEP